MSNEATTFEKSPEIAQFENDRSADYLIAMGFLNQKYPLNNAGQQLSKSVRACLQSDDLTELAIIVSGLPTVEEPHLELFEPLNLTNQQEEEYFGFDNLSNIQCTKGCTHNCTFCAIEAGRHVQIMPFAAVLQIAEVKKGQEKEARQENKVLEIAWQSWRKTVMDKIGFDLNAFDEKRDFRKVDRELYDSEQAAHDQIYDIYSSHPIRKIMPAITKNGAVYLTEGQLLTRSNMPWRKRLIHTYYDSDDFDYRDFSFRHKDGRPADFSDVFKALASEERPVHITTAGWNLSDAVAQRAAKQLSQLYSSNRQLFYDPRISVNMTERMARKDPSLYLKQMMNVIGALCNLRPQVLLRTSGNIAEDISFRKAVIDPLIQFMESFDMETTKERGEDPENKVLSPKIIYTFDGFSYYSGKIATEEGKKNDPDVAACMGGIHILPNGDILRQHIDPDAFPNQDKDRGQRPQQLNVNIFP